MIYYKEKSDYISAPKARHVTPNFNNFYVPAQVKDDLELLFPRVAAATK